MQEREAGQGAADEAVHNVGMPNAGIWGYRISRAGGGAREGGLRRAAAGHSVRMPVAGMGADVQEREVGQGEGSCRVARHSIILLTVARRPKALQVAGLTSSVRDRPRLTSE